MRNRRKGNMRYHPVVRRLKKKGRNRFNRGYEANPKRARLIFNKR